MSTNQSSSRNTATWIVVLLVAFSVILGGVWIAVEWTVNRITVPDGWSLQLQYKGPPLPLPFMGVRPKGAPGEFAKVDENGSPLELGVLEELRGPGRHFYSPFWWDRKLVEDIVVKPGEVGIVISRMGKSFKGESNRFLVDGDLGTSEYKGILRKAFGPGKYRVNPYAYDFKIIKSQTFASGNQDKHAGWVEIPTGSVGVVTNLTSNPLTGATEGVQREVLPPGIYPINPNEQNVDIVDVGYRERSITAELKVGPDGNLVLDDSGEPVIANADSGISFPSNDGFPIQMDFTAIWGIMPDQAAEIISEFGTVDVVENRIVIPQIESICLNNGSSLGAVELLVGNSRLEFQKKTSEQFANVLQDKGITVLNGLVRHIYIPQEVRIPIQQAFIADELKLTRQQEQLTAETEALLRESEENVKLATQEVVSETEKLVAAKEAEGRKTAAETGAETKKLVAAIDRKSAELEAEATVLLGQAQAQARLMQEEARSDKFRLAVESFGAGEAYNQWVFATGLPDDIELNMIYAGEGTFWTDLKGFTDVMLGRQTNESRKSTTSPTSPPTQPVRVPPRSR
mgnify:FL=1